MLDDLDARDEGHPDGNGLGGQDIAIPGERVVVGQGEQPDADVCGRPEQDRWFQDAVRPGRMGMEVDGRGAGWLDATGARRRQGIVAAASRPGRHVTPR